MYITDINEFVGGTSWLSNTSPCIINVKYNRNLIVDFGYIGGEIFQTVEHAYKYIKFIEPQWKLICLTERSAKRVAELSFEYENKFTLTSDWVVPERKQRLDLMYALNKIKYSQEPFKTLLKNTKARNLIEGNTWGDTFLLVWF